LEQIVKLIIALMGQMVFLAKMEGNQLVQFPILAVVNAQMVSQEAIVRYHNYVLEDLMGKSVKIVVLQQDPMVTVIANAKITTQV
jgi:hypothetical protein